MIPRLKKCYTEEIIPKLMHMSEFHYQNKQQVPYIQKIVINRGLGDASQNEQILKSSHKNHYNFTQNYNKKSLN